ncbi:PDZ domain-containing protein [Thalassotalea sp. 1_MG-2023]|uniref:M61 family metallopeptidase n=1 Tax=Thalassotalea sp. 1_MG-2023 TaxID=3062680 RepID=UPI0026E2B7BF|nr:PDZ domain-containing protein [Thalassotalea sp. 1_MG-2023]MDO6428618.1 PDZ domain-containing protein [Thalassotalea sp. 1_MG-2023]
MQKLSHHISSLSFASLAFLSANSFADVLVNIDLNKAEHHYANVTMTIPESAKNSIDLKLPTWRTGRYEILNLANGIREFSVEDDDVSWKKIDKDTWRLTGDLKSGVEISYQVYANQLGYRTRHVDDSHAFLDASGVVMYTEETRDDKHIIQLDTPKNWRSVSGLKAGKNAHQFIAEDFDILIDSPIETGINEFHEFTVDGREYELVIWGKGNYDSEKMVKDLKALVAQGSTIWSDYPFDRYVFMVHATSGARGATEHLNSTIIQRSRYSFSERKDYLQFLGTAAHEFVHTWNVKQYRPEGLVPYDYQNENYSNLLWLAEGSTSYLQNQLLMRGELMTTKEWLKSLSKSINGFKRKPGRDAQSVAEASFDKWISEGGDYDKNHSVNIYSEGFLVSWMLDFDILEKTKLKKSYRNVHDVLYKEYSIPKTFNDQDMLAVLKKVTGENYQSWWQKNVDGHAKPDFNKLLAKAGLEISYGKEDKKKAWTGLSTSSHSNGLLVRAVEKGSPAWQAGFTTDDIIVAVDGLRIADKDLKKRLTNFKPETEVEFTFFRRDQLMTKTITLAAVPKDELKVQAMKDASKAQKAFFKAWTGLDFPEKKADEKKK